MAAIAEAKALTCRSILNRAAAVEVIMVIVASFKTVPCSPRKAQGLCIATYGADARNNGNLSGFRNLASSLWLQKLRLRFLPLTSKCSTTLPTFLASILRVARKPQKRRNLSQDEPGRRRPAGVQGPRTSQRGSPGCGEPSLLEFDLLRCGIRGIHLPGLRLQELPLGGAKPA